MTALRIALPIVALLCGCDTVESNNRMTGSSFAVMPEIRYFRDHRVGLCFAYFYQRDMLGNQSTGGPVLATVPCEAVERLLVNGGVR